MLPSLQMEAPRGPKRWKYCSSLDALRRTQGHWLVLATQLEVSRTFSATVPFHALRASVAELARHPVRPAVSSNMKVEGRSFSPFVPQLSDLPSIEPIVLGLLVRLVRPKVK